VHVPGVVAPLVVSAGFVGGGKEKPPGFEAGGVAADEVGRLKVVPVDVAFTVVDGVVAGKEKEVPEAGAAVVEAGVA
jgi:hypothetical protein